MPEGIDQAADAFRSEIAPAAPVADRSRDGQGRFTPTSKPEPMFEPRPIEGDPQTGDTRDGGDDPRLAAHERRVADGRSEDDEPHANDNLEAVGDNETPEQIGEGKDAEDKAKPGEGEDEGPKYEVTVDGQKLEVSLKEALEGYQRTQAFHARMSRVAEAQRAVEQEATNVVAQREQLSAEYTQKLELANRVLADICQQQQFDWDREFAVNPHEARMKQKALEAIQGRVQFHADQMHREAYARQVKSQQDAAEYDRISQKYAVEQFTQFVQEANIPDEKILNEKLALMRNYAKTRGFSEGEIATVYDKRMQRVLLDAAEHHQATIDKPKPIQPGKGKTLAPGVASPVGSVTRRSLDEAMNKLAKTGRLDDADLVFQRLIR